MNQKESNIPVYDVKEEFLHHIWQYRLYPSHQLTDNQGNKLEIIDPGKYNGNAGPDFINAKIKIGDTLWAGNVEIHKQSTDWHTHKHDQNTAYNSVVLHVVLQINALTKDANGRIIPQLILPIHQSVSQQWETLITQKQVIRCSSQLHQLSDFSKHNWIDALVLQRLEAKTARIEQLLQINNSNWEETFYYTLARNFGFGINNEPFEWLAKALPLTYISKHKDNLVQIEAMLFGQSGLLALNKKHDDYTNLLEKEYAFLQQKFNLKPIDGNVFKLMRLRPANFPHIRLAQFASLIHQSSKLFSQIIEEPEYNALRKLFQVKVSSYWEQHYTFGELSVKRQKHLGDKALDNIIINTIVPMLFAYGKRKNRYELQEKALHLLEQCVAEDNRIIREWSKVGLKTATAYDTQALIQLNNEYCVEKKCLFCRFGHQLLQLSLKG